MILSWCGCLLVLRCIVWITGHMAPVTRTLPRSSILFQRIVARYSPHVIAGIFSGHYHQDRFVVVHDPDAQEQTRESAINVIFEGPSITPLDKSNPVGSQTVFENAMRMILQLTSIAAIFLLRLGHSLVRRRCKDILDIGLTHCRHRHYQSSWVLGCQRSRT
jgi:hypothetical protein